MINRALLSLSIGFVAVVGLAFPGLAGAAAAHEIRPAIVTVKIAPDQRFSIKVTANLEALIAKIGPQHKDSDASPQAGRYNQLRALAPDELARRFRSFAPIWLEGIKLTFDGARSRPALAAIEVPATGDTALARISTLSLAGKVPAGARTVQWSYAAKFGSSVLRVSRPGDEKPVTSWLKSGAASKAIPLQGAISTSWTKLLADYVGIGFTHIVPKGLDHILFVLGLYLLSTQARPLLMQVTAFTLAHSITLALGLYGVVQLSPAIVEPLIAASIVYVAVENILTSKLSPWRPMVVFGFGLLHGLGFAGVLREIGLPRSDYVTGLIGFNIGVELGQLAVIALAFLATGLWFSGRSWYRARIVVPASLVIAAIGLYWSVERVFLT